MISDARKLIDALNKQCKDIVDKKFQLDKSEAYFNGNREKYCTHGCEDAVSRIKDESFSKVSVYNLYNDFYIYIEVDFSYTAPQKRRKKPHKSIASCSISISIFKKIDEDIIQLFRAEWSEYEDNPSNHPQPHWHFTANKFIAKNFELFNERENKDFGTHLNSEMNISSQMDRLHFAMCGKWCEGETDVNSMESPEKVAKWFGGLLVSIKEELRYVDSKQH